MKTLSRYVFGSFLSSFLLAFLVLSFVLTIGLMIQIVGLLLDGVQASLIAEFAAVSFPETLQWTMPLALLVSSILVFSRLSADSEIAAMRACGVNLLSVMKGPIAFAVLCTLLGFYVNNEIVPRGHEVRRSLKNKVSVGTGLEVLKPGVTITDFPKAKIYFGKREGNWLYDLFVVDYSNPKIDRMITASKALVQGQDRDITLDLYDMTVDPWDADHPTMARAERFQYVIKDALKGTHYTRRVKDFRFLESLEMHRKFLSQRVRIAALAAKNKDPARAEICVRQIAYLDGELSALKTEISKRLVFALASLCFALVGIPLGIRAQRKESTVGMAIALAISLGYYVVVILMLSLDGTPAAYPHLLIWLPVVACLALASRLIPRNL